MAQQQGSLQNLPRPESLFGAVKGGLQPFAGALVALLNNWYLLLQQATAIVIAGVTEKVLGFTRASLGIDVNGGTPRLIFENNGVIWEIDNEPTTGAFRFFKPGSIKAQFISGGIADYFEVSAQAVFGALVAAFSTAEPIEVQGTGAGISYIDRTGNPAGATPRWVTYATNGQFNIWNQNNAATFSIVGALGFQKFFMQLGYIPVFANNAAAIAGGLGTGNLYRTGGDPDFIAIVH